MAGAVPAAQATRGATPKPKAKDKATVSGALKKQAADEKCPALLGTGVTTRRQFCDVLTGSDPATGILIQIPPHRGEATLSFDLHNRQTYSEQEVRAKRAFAHSTASIGVFTMDNTLISRAVVDSEFRTAKDLLDRIGGGAGPGGVKAVAPTGSAPITVQIPADADTVSILGEKLIVVKSGTTETHSAPGRPIAAISNVMIEYRPAPARKPAPKTIRKK